VALYDDSKMPWQPSRDDDWISEGRSLLDELQRELFGHGIDLQPDEEIWRTVGPE
jgi:hypothetical protein